MSYFDFILGRVVDDDDEQLKKSGAITSALPTLPPPRTKTADEGLIEDLIRSRRAYSRPAPALVPEPPPLVPEPIVSAPVSRVSAYTPPPKAVRAPDEGYYDPLMGMEAPTPALTPISLHKDIANAGKQLGRKVNIVADALIDNATLGLGPKLAGKGIDIVANAIGAKPTGEGISLEPQTNFEKTLQTGGGLAGDLLVGGALLKGGKTVFKGGKAAIDKGIDLWKATPTAVKIPTAIGAGATAFETGRGALDPGYAERRETLPSELGASLRAGTGDVIGTAGNVLKWKGIDNAGQVMVDTGKGLKDGFELAPEEFSWKSFFNPDFYAKNVARSVPFMAALVPLMYAGFKVGKGGAAKAGLGEAGKLIAGAITGSALSRPVESALEAGGVFEEALAKGMSPAEADAAAQQVFERNLSLAGWDVVQLGMAFAPGAARFNKLGKALTIGGKLGFETFTEAVEEGIQTGIQQQALGDDERSLMQQILHPTPEMKESMGIGGLFGIASLGGAGAVSDYLGGAAGVDSSESTQPAPLSQVQAAPPDQVATPVTPQAAPATGTSQAESQTVPLEGRDYVGEALADVTDTGDTVRYAPGNIVYNQSGDALEILDATNPEFLVVQDESGTRGLIPRNEVTAEAPGQSQAAEVEIGNPQPESQAKVPKGIKTVYHPKTGEPLQVIDDSDPAMYTVANSKGTTFKIGRGAVKEEAPAQGKYGQIVEDEDGNKTFQVVGKGQEEAKAEEPAVEEQPKKNIGYHAGDLGKAEHYGRQEGSSRGTGHFGTGTYFVGNKEEINYGNFKDRPQHEVNFDGYNLFTPKDWEEANVAHEFLKTLNNGKYKRSQMEEISEEDVYDNPDLKEDAKKIRYAKEDVAELVPKMAKLLGISEAEVKATIDEVIADVERERGGEEDYKARLRMDKTDSISTRFMKRLGYEGVDVRHVDSFDNTGYGSVIYDIKEKGQPKPEAAEIAPSPSAGTKEIEETFNKVVAGKDPKFNSSARHSELIEAYAEMKGIPKVEAKRQWTALIKDAAENGTLPEGIELGESSINSHMKDRITGLNYQGIRGFQSSSLRRTTPVTPQAPTSPASEPLIPTQAAGPTPVQGPTPDPSLIRKQVVPRGNKGPVNVFFPDQNHIDLFEFAKNKGKRPKDDVIMLERLRSRHEIPEGTDVGEVADKYRQHVTNLIGGLKKGSEFSAPTLAEVLGGQYAGAKTVTRAPQGIPIENARETDKMPRAPFRIEQSESGGWVVYDARDVGWLATGSRERAEEALAELNKKYGRETDPAPKAEPQEDVAKPPQEGVKSNQGNNNIIEVTPEPTGGPAAEESVSGSPVVRIAKAVKVSLEAGKKLTNSDLVALAKEAHGTSLAEGKYSIKDVYDAAELGVNFYLLEHKKSIGPLVDAEMAGRILASINTGILANLPTQANRTEEQVEFQQFSTPPNLAYVAGWVANVTAEDTMLEPSAGIGGLAVFAKTAGAEVIVNELSERRATILKEMGFDQVFTENAEQLNNILSKDVKPTVVIMNPPFSSTAGRMKGKTNTKNAIPHIEQALKRLQPDGRLVAIVGRGMSEDAASFKEWWAKVKQEYNVRANIGIDGKNYAKYGTTFDVQLLVIDKNGPTTGATITNQVESLEEVLPILEGIKYDRIQIQAGKDTKSTQSKQDSKEEPGAGEGGRGPRVPASDTTDTLGDRGSRSGSREPVEPRSDERPAGNSNEDVREKSPEGDGLPGKTGTGRGLGMGERSESGEPGDAGGRGGVSGGTAPGSSGKSGSNAEPTSERLSVESQDDTANKGDFTDAVYSSYTPQKLKIKGAVSHPGKLAQSSAMAAVEPPEPTYRPALPKEIISKGLLSDAQLEAVVYAGQAHEQVLPDGQRKGFFIGDGTGVGKGREISGIILDNMNQGRKKAVWVSKNDPLIDSAKRDFGDVGGNPDLIFKKPKAGAKIANKEGVLFVSYDTLGSGQQVSGSSLKARGEASTRLDQIVEWLGEDFDGVIAFDEAHGMRNSIAQRGSRGVKKPAARAMAGVELQQRLPNARIVYVSATGASEVANLAYADRLGLWGEGTPFSNKLDFIARINAGGLAAMELVARDMKALGVYIARTLDFNGVTYSTLEHQLTPEQVEIYDAMAEGWQIVLQNIAAALKATNGEKGNAKRNAMGQFWGSHQRFFNQVLTSMQMPAVVKQVKEDLKQGNAVVLQLVNTNEASQERKLAGMDAEDSLEDLDLTPREMLMRYLENSFPVQQYEPYVDDNGNVKTRPAYDSQGKPVLNAEAVAMRDDLLDRLGAMRVPEGPLEIILNEFGHENVAEITGRKRRVVRTLNPDTGQMEKTIQKLPKSKVEADEKAFMDDKKQILIFSDAGGTGRSYHADLTKKNQRDRKHYLVQAGWIAENAVQGFGRTHRTNQASAPHYLLVTTNLKGQKRFISSIARRLDQLGALTKGQRQTGGQGLFSAKDNLESSMARDALRVFYESLARDIIPGLSSQDIFKKMGLDGMLDENGNIKEDADVTNIPKFLNRVLSLNSADQNVVFDAFSDRLDAIVEAAAAKGQLDVGLENFRADGMEVKNESTVYVDPSGAETKYVELEASHRNTKISFEKASQLGRQQDRMGFFKNTRSGNVYAIRLSGNQTTAGGSIVNSLVVQGQTANQRNIIPQPQFEKGNWEKLTEKQAEKLWNEKLEKAPDFRKEKVHLITGALLPIWDRLPDGHVRVVRVKTDDGDIMLGRVIPDNAIDHTLKRLDVPKESKATSPQEAFQRILNNGDAANLSNGWRVVRRRVAGEYRVEITGDNLASFSDRLQNEGVFTERIEYRTRFFIPNAEVMARVVKYRPIVELVTNRPSVSDSDVNLSAGGTSDWSQDVNRSAPATDGDTGRTVRRQDIIRDLAKAFAPIRVGRFRQKALGVFKTWPEVIRTKYANDLSVVSHEVGHYLDKLFNLSDSAFDSELQALGAETSKPSYTRAKIRGEGVAEFVRLYLTKPKEARSQAPNFFANFEQILDDNPEVKDAVLTAQNDVRIWYTQPAKARVLGSISTDGKPARKMTLSSLYTAVVDELHPLKEFVEKAGSDIPLEKNPFKLAWLARGWSGKAQVLLQRGVLDRNGNKIGKSFQEVLEPVKDELDDFRAFIVAKHSLEVAAQDKLTGIYEADAQAVIDDAPSSYDGVLKDLVEYQDHLMSLLVDAGIMKQESVEKMREMYPNYVPFHRVFEEDAGKVAAWLSKGGFANLRNPVMYMKGSTRDIIDPLESIVKNTFLFTNIAEKNKVGRAIAELAEDVEGIGSLVEKVVGRNSAKDNVLTIYKDGKALHYQLDPDLYQATLALDSESTNLIVQILSMPASWLRAGAVLSPDFMVRNPMRDMFTAFAFSNYGFIPVVDNLRGIFHALKKDDMYWQYLNSGSAQATLVSMDRDYLQKGLRDLIKQKVTLKSVAKGIPKAPSYVLEILRSLSELSEYSTRIGVFEKAIKAGANPLEAALESRDVTLDFGRYGTKTKSVNKMVAFWNACIQGIDKMRRQFAQKPVQTTLKCLIGITLPSIILFMLNKDDDRYKELPRWQKDLFWIILTEDSIIRIPKPFELGILFGTVPERAMEWMYEEDPKAFEGLGTTIFEAAMPGVIPTAFLPWIEVITNYSFFTARPIVPMSEQGLKPSEQYNSHNTELAIGIGKAINVSPRKIESLIRGYTGGLGMYAARLTDYPIEAAGLGTGVPDPQKTMYDIPGLKGITIKPYSSAKSVDDFYNKIEGLEVDSKTAKKTGEKLSGKKKAELTRLRAAKSDMDDILKEERKIRESKTMTPEAKRRRLDITNMKKLNIARRALGKSRVN